MKKEEEALTTLPSSLSSSFSNNIHSFIMNNDNYGSTTTTKSIKDLIIDLFARKMSFCEFNSWGGCLLYPKSFINLTNAENWRFLVSYTYEDWVNTVLSLDTNNNKHPKNANFRKSPAFSKCFLHAIWIIFHFQCFLGLLSI